MLLKNVKSAPVPQMRAQTLLPSGGQTPVKAPGGLATTVKSMLPGGVSSQQQQLGTPTGIVKGGPQQIAQQQTIHDAQAAQARQQAMEFMAKLNQLRAAKIQKDNLSGYPTYQALMGLGV